MRTVVTLSAKAIGEELQRSPALLVNLVSGMIARWRWSLDSRRLLSTYFMGKNVIISSTGQ